MNTYIFITFNISKVGGAQMYVSSKAKYLESIGWKVVLIFPSSNKIDNRIIYEKYLNGELIGIELAPHEYFNCSRNLIVREIISKINLKGNESEIIIESNNDIQALWAELVANKINAKHICFNCNEIFRGEHKKNYTSKIDFFDFKHKRRELACISNKAIKNLFYGYKTLPDEECYWFEAAHYGAIQNVDSNICIYLEKHLLKKSWNICYFGRINKQYVNNILKGISVFSANHQNNNINLIFIGDISNKKNQIFSIFKNLSNVNLIELGNLFPIPKLLFKYFDVVIAGAGCAISAVQQHVLTIVPDPNNSKCNGVFGIDTNSSLFAEPNLQQTSFEECLEKVFIKKTYNVDSINWLKPCSVKEINDIFENHLAFARKSDNKKCFYNIKKLCSGKKKIKNNILYFFHKIRALIYNIFYDKKTI